MFRILDLNHPRRISLIRGNRYLKLGGSHRQVFTVRAKMLVRDERSTRPLDKRKVRLRAHDPWRSLMEPYAHDASIANYRKLIAASALDPNRDEARHAMLLTLLAAELALDRPPPTCSRGY